MRSPSAMPKNFLATLVTLLPSAVIEVTVKEYERPRTSPETATSWLVTPVRLPAEIGAVSWGEVTETEEELSRSVSQMIWAEYVNEEPLLILDQFPTRGPEIICGAPEAESEAMLTVA